MSKRLEVMVRLVDGSQLYWDATTLVEPLTVEEAEALTPRGLKATPSDLQASHEAVRQKFLEAADRLWERAMQRVR